MSRIPDAFDELIAQHPAGDPDAILDAARQEVRVQHARRRTVVGLATAAVLVVALAIAALVLAAGDDDPGAQVHAGGGTTSTELPTTSVATVPATVEVFFGMGSGTGCQDVAKVERPIDPRQPATPERRLETALVALLDGPSAVEQESGMQSLFTNASRALASVEVTETGTKVDFDGSITTLVPNASTACGSASIVAQLTATVSAIDGLGTRTFTIDGDEAAFFAWLNIEPSGPGATTTTTAPPAAVGTGFAIASPRGVLLRTGSDPSTDLRLAIEPAAAAFTIGTDVVVYQGVEAGGGDRVAPWPGGPILRWARDGGTADVPVPEGFERAVLLDAGTVDGSPKALVALRRGDTPDTAREALTLIDLRTFEPTTVVDLASWESGHVQARLLPDGDVIGLVSGEASWSVARWTSGQPDPVWTSDAGFDTQFALAIGHGQSAVVETLSPGGLSMRGLDLETGALGIATRINVSIPDTQLWCGDWYDAERLACARSTGAAGAVTTGGAWGELSTPIGALVTASRS